MVSEFVNEFILKTNVKTCLIVSAPNKFDIISRCCNLTEYSWTGDINLPSKVFDLVFIDLSTIGNTRDFIHSFSEYIIPSFCILFIQSKSLRNTRSELNSEGIRIIAIIGGCFENSFYLVVCIQTGSKYGAKIGFEFVAEIENPFEIPFLINDIFCNRENQKPERGYDITEGDFYTFFSIEKTKRIDQLKTDYRGFKEIRLMDAVISTHSHRDHAFHLDDSNCIYLGLTNNKFSFHRILKELKFSHRNYYQLELDFDIINADYLFEFLNSPIGLLCLDGLIGGTARHFGRDVLHSVVERLKVFVPNLPVQSEIVDTITKLNSIKNRLLEFEENILLNPLTSGNLQKIDSMLEIIDELAESDKIKTMIRGGESKIVEFKQTLSLCLRTNKKEKYIEDSILKTIAGFMNTDGGTLLVGVDDTGSIIGVEAEISKAGYKNYDKYLLHLNNMLEKIGGAKVYSFLNPHYVSIEQKKILAITCLRSTFEVFVDDKDFYVRTNPATVKLEGISLSKYLKLHFPAVL